MKLTITGTTELSKAIEDHINGRVFPTECYHCKSDNLRLTPLVLYCFDCGRTQEAITPYAIDANAALELWDSNNLQQVGKYQTKDGWYVDSHDFWQDGPTFCVVVCLAALRSKGLEVEYRDK